MVPKNTEETCRQHALLTGRRNVEIQNVRIERLQVRNYVLKLHGHARGIEGHCESFSAVKECENTGKYTLGAMNVTAD